jgi:hypothetical protein
MLLYKPNKLTPLYGVSYISSTSSEPQIVISDKAIFSHDFPCMSSKITLRNITNKIVKVGLKQLGKVGIDDGRIETYVELAPRQVQEVLLLGLKNQIQLEILANGNILLEHYEVLDISNGWVKLHTPKLPQALSSFESGKITNTLSGLTLSSSDRANFMILPPENPNHFQVLEVTTIAPLVFNKNTTINHTAIITSVSPIYLTCITNSEVSITGVTYEQEIAQQSDSYLDTSNLEIWT